MRNLVCKSRKKDEVRGSDATRGRGMRRKKEWAGGERRSGSEWRVRGRHFKKNLFPQDFYMQMRHRRCSTERPARLGSARAGTDLHPALYIHTPLSLSLLRRKPAGTRAVSLVLLMIRKCRREVRTTSSVRRGETRGWRNEGMARRDEARYGETRGSEPGWSMVVDKGMTRKAGRIAVL